MVRKSDDIERFCIYISHRCSSVCTQQIKEKAKEKCRYAVHPTVHINRSLPTCVLSKALHKVGNVKLPRSYYWWLDWSQTEGTPFGGGGKHADGIYPSGTNLAICCAPSMHYRLTDVRPAHLLGLRADAKSLGTFQWYHERKKWACSKLFIVFFRSHHAMLLFLFVCQSTIIVLWNEKVRDVTKDYQMSPTVELNLINLC